jgi:hypothetical protein
LNRFISVFIVMMATTRPLAQEPVQFKCEILVGKKLMYCTPLPSLERTGKIRVVDVIGTEMQKYIMEKDIEMSQIDYSVDTLIRAHAAELRTTGSFPVFPENIIDSIGADYLLVVYDLSGENAEWRNRKVTTAFGGHFTVTGSFMPGPTYTNENEGDLSQVNKYDYLSAKMALIDCNTRQILIGKDVVVEAQGDNVNKPFIEQILSSIGEKDLSAKNEWKSCLLRGKKTRRR